MATFLHCCLITLILAPSFKKIAKNNSVNTFVDGITAAVIGTLEGAVVVIAMRSINDIPTALIAAGSMLSLIFIK